jgi:hypothetical protein
MGCPSSEGSSRAGRVGRVSGPWSVKDVVAHIAWHEKEMIGLIERRDLAAASPWWDMPTDKRNQLVYEENKDRPLADVMTEAHAVHAQLAELLPALTDTDLCDPGWFAGMPADWVPWDVIAGNTYEHYAAHAETVGKWLKQKRT